MKGKLIVIDGTDGSGKTGQTTLLLEHMRREGHQVKTLSFPTYGTESCKGVELYLNGELGSTEFIGPYFGSMLYAFNRSKETSKMKEELEKGTHYVLNRYTAANAGHQGGKISDKEEREEFLDWLFDLEFKKFNIPKPDMTIFLHMPPEIGQQFVAKKSKRSYLVGKSRDLHERDLLHLKNAEQSYLYAAKKYGWVTVGCALPDLKVLTDRSVAPEEKVKTPQNISKEVCKHADNLLNHKV